MASRFSFLKSIFQSLSSVPRCFATIPLRYQGGASARNTRQIFINLLFIILLLGVPWPVALRPAMAVAAIRYVAPTGTDGANDCTNPASPCATIGHALTQAAVEGDTISMVPGTYTESLVIDGMVVATIPVGKGPKGVAAGIIPTAP